MTVGSIDLESENLNSFWLRNGEVWTLQSYCHQPTLTMRKVGSDETVSFAVGSIKASEFDRLVVKENRE